MTLGKNNYYTVTIDPDLTEAQEAINTYRSKVTSPKVSYKDKLAAAVEFENVMNGLSGVLLNQPKDEQRVIQGYCYELLLISAAVGVQLNLYKTLLPQDVISEPKNSYVQGKKLYPRTETVAVAPDEIIVGSNGVIANGKGVISPTASRISGTSASAGAGVSSTGKIINPDGTVSATGSGSGKINDAGTGVPSEGEARAKLAAALAVAADPQAVLNSKSVAEALATAAKAGLSVAEAVTAAAEATSSQIQAATPEAPFVSTANTGGTTPAGAALPASGEVVPSTPSASEAAAANAASQQIAANFEELDKESANSATNYANTAISNIGYEDAQILPEGLLAIIKEATSNASSTLQQDLTALLENPSGNAISNTVETIAYYANNNFAALDAALPAVAADVNLTAEYEKLKVSIAGADGLSGALAFAKAYEEHTKRISGLLLEDTNEFAEETGESRTQNLVYNDLLTGVSTTIITFDATKYRSAKYYIQATSGIEHQMSEYTVIHDNGRVYGREVDTTYTIDPFISFTSAFSGTNVEITALSTLPNTNLVIYGIKLKTAKAANTYPEMSQNRILENHRTMKSHFNDNVDYVAMQTGSVLNNSSIATLARSVTDMITYLTDASFVSGSTIDRKDKVLSIANTINSSSTELQSLIDSDYNNFIMLSKRAEVLKMAMTWSESNEDPFAKALIDKTLKSNVRENLE